MDGVDELKEVEKFTLVVLQRCTYPMLVTVFLSVFTALTSQ